MPITIRQIAEACGTSKTTVSKVLTGNDAQISREKRQLIHDTMARLNYRPSAAARALCTKRTNTIGLVSSRVSHMVSRPYYGTLLDSVLDAATEANQRLTLHNIHGGSGPAMDPLLFADEYCDGLILLGLSDPETLRAIEVSRVPVVTINGGHPGAVPISIQIDDELAGYDATKYLVEIGHRRIAYLHMPGINCSEKRLVGYRRALAEAGIASDDRLVLPFNTDPLDAYQRAAQIATNANLGVTALFCVSDEFALAAMHGLRDAGLHIPNDISVIGVDGVIESERSFPKLTTMSQSLKKLGHEAVRCLLDRIANPNQEAQRIVWTTELVKRASVSAPARP